MSNNNSSYINKKQGQVHNPMMSSSRVNAAKAVKARRRRTTHGFEGSDFPDTPTSSPNNLFSSGSAWNVLHWTTNDQKRLNSLDRWHDRMLEYHNNMHSKATASPDDGENLALGSESSDAEGEEGNNCIEDTSTIVAEALKFSAKQNVINSAFSVPYGAFGKLEEGIRSTLAAAAAVATKSSGDISLNIGNHLDPTSTVDTAARMFGDSGKDDTHDFYWVHLKDLSLLPRLAREVGMHELCLAGFEDFRAFSTMIVVPDACLITTCVFQMEQSDVAMFKLFIYVSKSIVITHQVQILADIENPVFLTQDSVVTPILANNASLQLRCKSLGSIGLLHELALAALSQQDKLLEYLAWTISYFNNKVHVHLRHQEKLGIMLKMHIISSSIVSVLEYTQESGNIFAKLLALSLSERITIFRGSPEGGTGSSYNPPIPAIPSSAQGLVRMLNHSSELISDVHIPYLSDLNDTYVFCASCLRKEFNQTVRLEEELDAVMSLRSSNTSIMLSLVATIFLPLTFLAGVFGMNFQQHGEYNIELLNVPWGPMVFVGMCVASIITTAVYFIAQGWVEATSVRRLYKFLTGAAQTDIDDSNKIQEQRAESRALAEDARRSEVSQAHRVYSVQAAASPKRGSISTATSAKTPIKQRKTKPDNTTTLGTTRTSLSFTAADSPMALTNNNNTGITTSDTDKDTL